LSRAIVAIASILILAAATPAAAGSFSISPIRVEFSANQKIGVLTVRNEQDTPVLVQVETLAWSQADNKEVYVATRDVLATPPVFTLPAQGQQILRVALRRDADTTRELSYRLALQEVVAEAPKEFTGLRVALRLSLPIFVDPPDGSRADLQWSAHVDASGDLAINATNQGNGHIQLSGFSVYLDSPDATFTNSGARYVLPGSHASWSFKTVGKPVAQSLTIRGYSDRGEFSAQMPIVLP
jgi:fimbrial chaperone protein